MIHVTLSPEEDSLAHWVAEMREGRDKAAGVVDNLVARRPSLSNTYQSMAAEIAVAKAMNVFPELNSDPSKIRDFDLVSPLLFKVDVKWTNHPVVSIPNNGRKCDAYVVVSGESPEFDVRGYIYCWEAKSDEFWAPTAPRPCWQVPLSSLNGLLEDLMVE
jgi:hypothetical protein